MMKPTASGNHSGAGARRVAVWLVVAATLTMGVVGGGAGCTLLAAKRPAATPTPTNGLPQEYVIDVGDVLEILVWRNEALSRVVTVRPDGKISLPLLNDVQAAGLTPMQLKEQVAQQLKKFKELPEVSVIVNDAKSQVIYVMGQVAKPGSYPLGPMGPNATVLQAIAGAGGFTPFADRNNIAVIRKDKKAAREQRLRVNYQAILSGRSTQGNVTLHAGDTIIVP